MNVPPEVSSEARRWLEQAAEDLMVAQRLADDLEMPPRRAAFLAHLAAEKALKGALIARGIPIRKIHDLVELQSTLSPADATGISSEDIDVLLPWNIAGRYPADMGDADLGDGDLDSTGSWPDSRRIDSQNQRRLIRRAHA